MKRVPFAVWLVPAVVLLPLLSGRLFAAPSWLKLGLIAAALVVPVAIVVVRYWSEPEPSDREFLRRRRAAFAVAVLVAVSVTWMAGGVDLENGVPLDAPGGDDAVRFDVTVALPPGGSLRDLEPVGPGVRAFYPRPEDPRIYRLLLAEPPGPGDVELLVRWRLPIWRNAGDVTVSVVPVDEG